MKNFPILLALLFLFSCKKEEIDFENKDVYTSGKIDLNSPFQTPWIKISTSGITNIDFVETDGVNIYFNGISGNQQNMFKLTPNGQITSIYTVSSGGVSHLAFHPPYMYACHTNQSSNSIKVFNENGIVNEINHQSWNNRIYDSEDVGPYILFGGDISNSALLKYDKVNLTLSGNVFGVNISYGIVRDISLINDTIYVAGFELKGTTDNMKYGALKWTGSSWKSIGEPSYSTSYYDRNYCYGVKCFDNKIFLTGIMDISNSSYESYVATLTDKLNDISIFKCSWTGNEIKTKVYENKLFVFGDIEKKNNSYSPVYYYDNGNWIGAGIFSTNQCYDITVLNNKLYGLIDGELYTYSLP